MMLRVQNPNYPPSTWLCTSAYTQGEENKQKEQKDFFFHLLTYILPKYFQSYKPGTGRVEIAITEPSTGASCPLHDQPHLPFFLFFFPQSWGASCSSELRWS